MIDSERLLELGEVEAPRGANGHLPRPYSREQLERFWRDFDYAYPPLEDPEMYLRRWERGSSRYARIMPHAKRLQAEAVVALALFGGLRKSEIFGLDLEEMSPEAAYLVVRGAAKNPEAVARPRIVPWNEPLLKAVAAWLDLRERLGPDHDQPLLSLHQEPHYRKPLRSRQFDMLVRNVGRGYEYHRFRHTFATEALRAGMPIEILQRVLGHANVRQTLVYAQLAEGDVLRAAARVEANFTRAIESTRP